MPKKSQINEYSDGCIISVNLAISLRNVGEDPHMSMYLALDASQEGWDSNLG
jgi:hypothetical protein